MRITIIIILFSLFACHKKSVIESELNDLGVNIKDFTRIDTTFYKNDKIKKLRFEKSKNEDIRIKFYPSGKKKSFVTIKNSQVHGELIDWYENGKIKWQRYYEYGNSIKKSTTYDENGNRATINNHTDGSFTDFYDNDNPRLKRSDSVFIDYYLSGQTKSSFIKKADGTHNVNFFNENGTNVFSGNSDSKFILYKNGSLFTGIITSEFLDGSISFNQNYTKGLPHGKCFSKYGNKNLEFELEFENGKEVGIHKRYFPNGKIQSIKNYNSNEYKKWDEKGNLVN